MITREEILTAISEEFATSGLAPAEVADLYRTSKAFRRLLGGLWATNQEGAKFISTADLISEEGRLRTIQQQGRHLGKVDMLDAILDLVMEGHSDEKVG